MSDPIEKLTRLGDALEGAPMPLPAAEIRARGDRIRRRRHAVVAGAAAAVVAAVAVPVIALTVGDGSSDKVEPAPQPTVTDPVPPAALGAANLLTADDAVWHGVGTDWTEGDTLPGDGQAPPNPCLQSSFAGLGATSVLQRDFTWSAQTDPADPWPYLTEIIGEFDSPAAARSAYDEIQAWHAECRPAGADDFSAAGFTPVDIPVDGEASTVTATYGPVAERLDPFGDERWILDTGLVVSGDRLALVTALSHGQDYNFEQTPAEQMVPAAARRLVLGGGGDGQVVPGDGRPTTIPDDFPLATGLPSDDGSEEFSYDPPSADNQALQAAGELTGCQDIDGGDPIDRLTTRLTTGQTYYGREVQLFSDDTAAMAYFDSVQDSFGSCAAQGPGYRVDAPDTGSASSSRLNVTYAEGVGRQVVIVQQAGNAVLVAIESDEGGGSPNGDVGTMLTGVAEGLAPALDALTALVTGADGGADPATAGIPDGFPLDAHVGDAPVSDGETTVTGPEPGLEAVSDIPVCGRATLTVPPSDRLGYTVAGIEGGERRELRTYPDADTAVAEVQAVRDAVAACDLEQVDGGSTIVWRVYDEAETGYDSVTFGYTYGDESGPSGTGGELFTVVRVGRAILVLSQAGEYLPESMQDAVPGHLEQVGIITPSMCEFTEDGCL